MLLQEWQDRRKAELDAHRRDVRRCFAVSDEVLLDTKHTPLPGCAVALAALAALDGPLQGARVPGAQHLSP